MDHTHSRREKLIGNLALDGVEGLLVSSVPNVRYLTGFTGDDSLFLLTHDRALIISDGRYATQIGQECSGLEAHIRPVGQTVIDAAADVIARLGVRRLAFEASVLTVSDFEHLKTKLPGAALVADAGSVEALRTVKDESEIALIRDAVAIAERAWEGFRTGLCDRQSEKDAADWLEGELRRCGASAASFPPIVVAGPRSALPHARPSDQLPALSSDFVLVDWGADGRGYKSDLTRVLVTGNVTAEFETIYRTVLAAQERAIAAIRPGAVARDVDAEARSVIEEAGFGRFFPHGLGHGLGLEIHESPRLRTGSEDVLQPGMVVTVEPGVYVPGWGGVRIEDDILVTADGCEVLTRVPKSFESVRAGLEG
jgi:Xaa-Pro aminopeptidase